MSVGVLVPFSSVALYRMTCDGTRMMMALFPTLKGAARPITTPITTYHIKHAPATSHKNQVNSLNV